MRAQGGWGLGFTQALRCQRVAVLQQERVGHVVLPACRPPAELEGPRGAIFVPGLPTLPRCGKCLEHGRFELEWSWGRVSAGHPLLGWCWGRVSAGHPGVYVLGIVSPKACSRRTSTRALAMTGTSRPFRRSMCMSIVNGAAPTRHSSTGRSRRDTVATGGGRRGAGGMVGYPGRCVERWPGGLA